MNEIKQEEVNVIGAGLAGLSAALALAQEGRRVRLISLQPSERAQSVLAAGGINAAIDSMGEGDSVRDHQADTLTAGRFLADVAAVEGLTQSAPDLVRFLDRIGVPFEKKGGILQQRYFGGQKKRRTLFSGTNTGKMVMTALIQEVRRYEAGGRICRYVHHRLEGLVARGSESGSSAWEFQGEEACQGVFVRDLWTGEGCFFPGRTILCFGGMNGLFPGATTGTTANSGEAAARVFAQGVPFSNLEMIQYHPTTIPIPQKRCLISEAARGEGGRLCILRGEEPYYFMEEMYPPPQLGNLMPRDIVAREIFFMQRSRPDGVQVYMDLRHIGEEVWRERLFDLREEVLSYLGLDPRRVLLPIEPAIHYFMGGIQVDGYHRSPVPGLYAAGECCSLYHGANRLGGNSMLGAIYGGRVAARSAMEDAPSPGRSFPVGQDRLEKRDVAIGEAGPEILRWTEVASQILGESMGIVRTGKDLETAEKKLADLYREVQGEGETGPPCSQRIPKGEEAVLLLSRAMVLSALKRTESRGAHFRLDFPQEDPGLQRMTRSLFRGGRLEIFL